MKFSHLCMAALAMLALASCHDGRDHRDGCDRHDDKFYAGILPAADVAGITYNLELDYDNETSGDYKLTLTYHDPTDSMKTVVDRSKGDFVVHKGTPADGELRYLQLTPKHRDRAEDKASNQIYFLITSPTTLELVGADLAPAQSGLNYTLTLQPGHDGRGRHHGDRHGHGRDHRGQGYDCPAQNCQGPAYCEGQAPCQGPAACQGAPASAQPAVAPAQTAPEKVAAPAAAPAPAPKK